jgi:hypothetical protein
MSAPDYARYKPEDFSCAHGGVHRCGNDFADHRGARLIRAVRRERMKDSPRPLLRFYYCAPTATLSVFTRPGPLAALPGQPNDRLDVVRFRPFPICLAANAHAKKGCQVARRYCAANTATQPVAQFG